MSNFIKKITSRKFLLAIAAFLASIGTSIAGLNMGNDTVTTIGTICAVASAAIYAAVEAYVDAASIKSTTTTNQNISSTVKKTETAQKDTVQ